MAANHSSYDWNNPIHQYLDELNIDIQKYLKIIFNELQPAEITDDYLINEFIFEAVNNHIEGYDICEYLNLNDYKIFKNIKNICMLIRYIVKEYDNMYGECNIKFDELEPEDLLRHYAYINVNQLSIDELKIILKIADDDNEYLTDNEDD